MTSKTLLNKTKIQNYQPFKNIKSFFKTNSNVLLVWHFRKNWEIEKVHDTKSIIYPNKRKCYEFQFTAINNGLWFDV